MPDADRYRLAPLIYEPEGARLAERLWEETMAELGSFKASEIMAEQELDQIVHMTGS